MTSRSSRLLERARKVIPGGVNSPVRAFAAVGGEPPFIARGEGAYLVDEDGCRYVDLVNSWGALLFGHAHPRVLAAAREAMERGSSFGAPTEGEVLLAEAIVAQIPSIEKVRLCSSGTEATMHAIRLARGATGRDLVVKMDGCYHGAHDALLASAGSGVATFARPGSPGIPASVAANTIVVPFNDVSAVEAAFLAHPDQIAAIIVEPVLGNVGTVAPAEGYLRALRELCTRHGAIYILDEVMTGFRLGPAGAQGKYGITPDLTCLGKIVGGGFPLAAFGGRADLMDRLSPLGPVYQAGTLSGNPVAVAAGLATLEMLDASVYEQLEATGAAIEAGLAPALAYHGWCLARVGSMFTVYACPVIPHDYATVKRCDAAAFGTFHQAALSNGVYLPPSQFEAAFLSTAIGDVEIAAIVDGLGAAFVVDEA